MTGVAGERVTIQSGDLKLEALFHLPAGDPPFPGVVICHPHPQYGGDMYNGVVGAIVEASLSVGLAALRFNFRGVGESEGAYEGGNGEVQDVAPRSHLSASPYIDPSRIALAGYSFGAVVALHHTVTDPGLPAVIAVSPPTTVGPARPGQPPLLVVWRPRRVFDTRSSTSSGPSSLDLEIESFRVPTAGGLRRPVE
jgi:alpha/beta superfamily hydrolase